MDTLKLTLVFMFFSLPCYGSSIDKNDFITDSGNAYIVATVVDAGGGFRSIAQLWNPLGSGRIVYIDKASVAHGYCAGNSGIDLRFNTSPLGAVTLNGSNKNLAITAKSVAQLRAAHVTAPVSNFTVYEIFQGACYKTHTVEFVPPIRLPEGTGAYFANGNDGANLPVTFEFREY